MSDFLEFVLWVCIVLGTYKVLKLVLSVLWYLFTCCARSQAPDLHARYANRGEPENLLPQKKSYAVVTGGSDGIGLTMCHKLAAQGFNICIIARNSEKIDGVFADLKKLYPNIETTKVIVDFSELSDIE